MSIRNAIDDAVVLVNKNGLTPSQASSMIYHRHVFNAGERVNLMKLGLASMINNALVQQRMKAGPKCYVVEGAANEQSPIERESKRELVEKVHSETLCDRNKCRNSYTERSHCVESLLLLAGEERINAIAKRREYNQETISHLEKMRTASFANMTKAIEKYANERAREILSDILLSVNGEMRTLLDFRLEDLKSWSRKSNKRKKGWEAREKWFKKASELLQSNDCETLADLSDEELVALSNEAVSVWGKAKQTQSVERRRAGA